MPNVHGPCGQAYWDRKSQVLPGWGNGSAAIGCSLSPSIYARPIAHLEIQRRSITRSVKVVLSAEWNPRGLRESRKSPIYIEMVAY